MLIENEAFTRKSSVPRDLEENVYRYCSFEDLDVEGLNIDGAFMWCHFKRTKLYWAFFNVAALWEVKFEDCVFPGAAFRGCILVRCRFERCRLTRPTSEARS